MLARETIILSLLCFGDLFHTVYLIQVHGWSEGNPLMAAVLAAGLLPFILVKLLSFMPALILAEWCRRRRPGCIERVMRVVAVLYVAIYAVGLLGINAPAIREAVRPPFHSPTAAVVERGG
ncbi:MAG: hypothetical protein HY320_14850 [Armatimonadetes bacterium]|nr:hypothetical protein [Armatimonadota bacterium]